MNEAKEFLKKKGLSESNNFGGYGGDNVAKLLSEYAQQVKQELFKEIESQKFFHALPPTAKDEYYEFVKNQQ